MNCYNCGKDIKPTESSISLDGINHSHDGCLRNPPKPAQCRFDELEDGEHFILAMTLAFGSSRVMQKVLEESDKYNAVWMENTNRSERIPADTQVVRVRDTTIIKPEAEDNTLSIDAFTMVSLSTSKYAFAGIELEGNEWVDIHSSRDWACMELANKHIWLCINKMEQYCFVFSDEADLFSQPYATVGEAKEALIRHMANL